MLSVNDSRRWFVTLTNGYVEDVGADDLAVGSDGSLIFRRNGIVSWVYGPGRWKFVEFQDEF